MPLSPYHQVPSVGNKKSTQTFFVQSFSRTLQVMDVRAENRGRPHQKVCFSAAPVMGRNSLTPGHPGVRVRNVHGNPSQKVYVYAVFSSLIQAIKSPIEGIPGKGAILGDSFPWLMRNWAAAEGGGKTEKKKAYTTTTERKSFGELFWPQRKTFQAGGGYKNL